MYASRGVGALLGPTVTRWAFGESERVLERSIGAGFVVLGLAVCGAIYACIATWAIWRSKLRRCARSWRR